MLRMARQWPASPLALQSPSGCPPRPPCCPCLLCAHKHTYSNHNPPSPSPTLTHTQCFPHVNKYESQAELKTLTYIKPCSVFSSLTSLFKFTLGGCTCPILCCMLLQGFLRKMHSAQACRRNRIINRSALCSHLE